MTSINNAGIVFKQKDRVAHYKIYDSLPPPLRKLLQDFVINLDPTQPYSMWRAGYSIPSIIRGAYDYLRYSPHATDKVYDRKHPEA